MVNLPTRHEEKLAIEKCLRSFIIKSIHAIVQARNGIVCNTNCVSEVGARNNMMVYVEEDPEIGATIKQTLDANFPVHVQDLLSLEILAHWPKEPQTLMVVEVWQFRLDIIERLDTATIQFTNNPNSTTCGNDANNINNNLPYTATTGAGSYPDYSKSTEYAVDDFRHLRLFEKLGTLLKSIMVVTRLLPGTH
ncbi:Autophagy-related protein 13 [Schistosoma japonicum]|nr:Autophagy-related protein 13 [Schistosoma japonicum]KAH8872629.1 Autophagy-related protein 13 [Schistosoma japonicum]KAH8872632.1 Autophagy-related protein 13 [Schistosoma japonicum]